MNVRCVSIAALVVAAAGCLSACSQESAPTVASATPSTFTPSDQAVIDEMNALPLVSTINGQQLPGTPMLVKSSLIQVDAPHAGRQVRVYQDIREPGTRSPIHVHPFGGWTCIASGQATLFAEGHDPVSAKAGECFDMPALTPMSNLNDGNVPAVLLDNFVTPPGAPIWRVIEADQQHLGTEFAGDSAAPSETASTG